MNATAAAVITESNLRFRTGAAMLARLGSEQLKDELTAVIELVKNAYDADATQVRFQIEDASDGQRLIIEDDGAGMSIEELHSKWAFLATENKVQEDRSPQFQRRRLGQKGVGRFAAEKLGSELVLRTSGAGPAEKFQVRFNWDELAGDRELGDYTFPIRRKKVEAYEPVPGTRLEVRKLRIRWTRARAEKLRAQLCSLIDPEATASDFRIQFFTPWPELNGELQNPLPGNETHSLEFHLDKDGHEEIRVRSYGSETVRTADASPPAFGPVRGKLRYFGQGLKGTERGRGGDPESDWNVGVRIFRDGCRVRPYGEPGAEGDWLQIYRARYLRGSRFRLKPHYLEGTVHISKSQNPNLRDTTSREGLTTGDAYSAFVEYVKEKVSQLSDLLRDEEIHEERCRALERYKTALTPLTAGLNEVRSEEYRRAVQTADKQVRKGLTVPAGSEIRNAHWECLDCSDSWKAPVQVVPTLCREFSVGRDGNPTNKPGCGSTNVRRKENVAKGQEGPKGPAGALDDVLTGVPAYVGGIQLKPVMDWDMGENDDEAEVRPERRELAINGRHRAFLVADSLDRGQTTAGTPLVDVRAVAALTVHVIDSASIAWGRWHARGQVDELLSKAAELKSACISRMVTMSSAGED